METSKNELNDVVVKLAQARNKLQECKDLIEFDPYIRQAMADKAKAADEVSALEAVVKAMVREIYIATEDKKPHDACSVRMVTVVEYDEAHALRWAQQNLTQAVQLNKKVFEQYAKEQTVKPLPFVTVGKQATFTIAQDLSAYAPVPAFED